MQLKLAIMTVRLVAFLFEVSIRDASPEVALLFGVDRRLVNSSNRLDFEVQCNQAKYKGL